MRGDPAIFGDTTEPPVNLLCSTPATATTTPLKWRREMIETNDYNHLRAFLTQRSIQTLMFYSTLVRDPHTAMWLEEFGGEEHHLFNKFHGTTGMNHHTWDGYIQELLSHEDQELIISTRRRGPGMGGWSKSNPYLKPRFNENKISLSPRGLAVRLLSIREQIASEFVSDLDLIRSQEKSIWESRRMLMADKSQDRDQVTFVRMGVSILSQSLPEGSTPLRVGAYDLLTLMSTHDAVLNILKNLRENGNADNNEYVFLLGFYEERLHFFEGSGIYGRADDFLEELIKAEATINTTDGSVLDPLRLAKLLLTERNAVCDAYSEICSNIEEDHLELRRTLLELNL
ncbi:hypothetical protein ScalyP_jg7736 [Parmales sp. scaly parma]|nr:hypothetical protein ScalyP_jg7736 [Parmales sp. scaly parma]